MADQPPKTSNDKKSRVRPSSSSTGSSRSTPYVPRPASARRTNRPPRKHARVTTQDHERHDREVEAPADAEHHDDQDPLNAEAKAPALAEDADMDGFIENSDSGIDDPEPPVHWSLWNYEDRYDWAHQVIEELPERDPNVSTKAILTTKLALPEVRLILAQLQVDIAAEDVMPTGWANEYLLKTMSPAKWAAIRLHLASDNDMKGPDGKVASLTPPESYKYYDDLCTVLYLYGFGPQGILSPRDVAVSMERDKKLPEPWRIHKMYSEDGKRINCVKIFWHNHRERSQVLNRGFIRINGDKCRIKTFASPSKVIRPRSHPTRAAEDIPHNSTPNP